MSIFARITEWVGAAVILIIVASAQGCRPAPETSLTTEDDEPVAPPPQMPGPEPSITTEEDDEEESPNDATGSSERITPPPIGE
jgi:hypothetical protein